MEPLLRLDSVEVRYGGSPAVRGVSFSLGAGEILGVVGESGSGKSSLLLAAIGLLGPGGAVTEGDILFEGESLLRLGEARMRRLRGAKIGMVFQDAAASLCPVRTVGSQIYECLARHVPVSRDEARGRALKLFSDLGFGDAERVWRGYPFELSGGMNQRVAVAMAMIARPALLLADEPTSALDAAAQKRVARQMTRLRAERGASIVIVTHNIGVAGAVADTLLVMKDGRAAEYGTAEQVLKNPRNAYTRELLAAVPRLRRPAR